MEKAQEVKTQEGLTPAEPTSLPRRSLWSLLGRAQLQLTLAKPLGESSPEEPPQQFITGSSVQPPQAVSYSTTIRKNPQLCLQSAEFTPDFVIQPLETYDRLPKQEQKVIRRDLYVADSDLMTGDSSAHNTQRLLTTSCNSKNKFTWVQRASGQILRNLLRSLKYCLASLVFLQTCSIIWILVILQWNL